MIDRYVLMESKRESLLNFVGSQVSPDCDNLYSPRLHTLKGIWQGVNSADDVIMMLAGRGGHRY